MSRPRLRQIAAISLGIHAILAAGAGPPGRSQRGVEMDDSTWERYAALGGIWFVVLSVISAFLPGAPPSASDSVVKIAKYFSDHSGAIEVATLLAGLGIPGLLWWFGSVWRLMADAEGGRPRMAVVALAGLATAAALALASGAISSTVALRHVDVGGAAKFFYVLTVVMIAMAGFGLVAHIAAVTSLSYRKKIFAPWINIIGWIAALLFLIGTIGVASDASAFVVIGLAAFLVWSLWIVVISLDIWKRVPAAS
jgi:hypothetical protein